MRPACAETAPLISIEMSIPACFYATDLSEPSDFGKQLQPRAAIRSGCFSAQLEREEIETYLGRAAGAEPRTSSRPISARFLPDSPTFLLRFNPTRKICVPGFGKVQPFIFGASSRRQLSALLCSQRKQNCPAPQPSRLGKRGHENGPSVWAGAGGTFRGLAGQRFPLGRAGD